MTPNEFKAWFDGFTEAFGNRIPSKAQWERIKARVSEIDGKPITERHYIDRYWPTYIKTYPSYLPTTFTTYCSTGTGVTTSGTATLQNAGYATGNNCFNSMQAMTDLGRAEAASIS